VNGSDGATGSGLSGDAGALVEEYLRLCEARDLDAACALLGPEPVLVFPGGIRHRTLHDMVAEAATRYRVVRKRREHPLVATCEDGSTLVLSRGTLEGEALDGTLFSGIRYLDVFVVRDGRIHEQHVLNDLAEAGVVVPVGAPGRTS
jgi:hypothetical protein